MRFGLGLFTALASITIAEFTTGSTALTKIITDPASFFLFSIPALFGLYGCGVILIREASVKWKKGWPTILLLGVAYGIMEEGISVHTFFSPVTQTVGVLGEYGKFLSLNVTWAILISIFHAVYSIALPILLGNLLWPEKKKQRLLTRRSGFLIFILYIITVVILFIIAPYKPSFGWVIVLLIFSLVLVFGSKRVDVQMFRKNNYYAGVSTKLYLTGGLFFFPFLIIFPRYVTQVPSILTDLLLIAVAILLYRTFEKRMPGNNQRKLAVMTVGLLFPLQVFGFILNISTNSLQLLAVAAIGYLEYRILKITRYPKLFSEIPEFIEE